MQRFFGSYRDNLGRPVAGGLVTVYNAGTSTLASINEATGSASAPSSKSNPFTTDGNGNLAFAAPYGTYDIQLTGANAPTVVLPNFQLANVDAAGHTLLNAADIFFTNVGAGAILQTVDTKLKQVINTKDYGGGSGYSQAVNKAALQLAITAASAQGGGTVIVDADVNYGYIRTDKVSGTATFATNVMTVVTTTAGQFKVGQVVVSAGVALGTTITGIGTYNGVSGTVTLSTSPGLITPAQAVTASPAGTWPSFTGITNDICVIDSSQGADAYHDGQQERLWMYTYTAPSGLTDGNGQWIRSVWNPYLALSNDADLTGARTANDNRQQTIFLNVNGTTTWGIGQGANTSSTLSDDELSEFCIKANGFSGLGITGLTNVLRISKVDSTVAWNAVPGTYGFNFTTRATVTPTFAFISIDQNPSLVLKNTASGQVNAITLLGTNNGASFTGRFTGTERGGISAAADNVQWTLARTGANAGSGGLGYTGDRDAANTFDKLTFYNGAFNKSLGIKLRDTGRVDIDTGGGGGETHFTENVASTTTSTGTIVVDTGGLGCGGQVTAVTLVAIGGVATVTLGGTSQTVTGTNNGLLEWKVTNSNAGTGAQAQFAAVNNSSVQTAITAHGSGRTGTHFGVVIGNYSEVSSQGASSNGLIIGNPAVDKPIIFGINAAVVFQLTGGTLASSVAAFSTTLDATNTTTGGVTIAGGLAVAKTIFAVTYSGALASACTGTTQTAANNSTAIATTAYVDRTPGNSTTTSAAPAGTASATAVMMGLSNGTTLITPAKTGRILIVASGQMANSTINDGVTVDLRQNTGNGPANGAAVTGTLRGISQTSTSLVAGEKCGFCITSVVTGLTIGTGIWIDLSLLAVTGGTASLTGVHISATEF